MQKSQPVLQARVVRSEREFRSRRMEYAQGCRYSVQSFADGGDIGEAAG
jgi:hypothetical protein